MDGENTGSDRAGGVKEERARCREGKSTLERNGYYLRCCTNRILRPEREGRLGHSWLGEVWKRRDSHLCLETWRGFSAVIRWLRGGGSSW